VKLPRPEFHLTRIHEDGSREPAEIVPVTAMPWETQMSRRGAFGAGLGAASLLLLLDRRAAASAGQRPATPTAPAIPPTQAPAPAARAHASEVAVLLESPDRQTVVSASDDNHIKIWSAADGRLIRTMIGHVDDVTALAPSPDGRMLFSGAANGAIRMWALDGSSSALLGSHREAVLALALTPDGRLLASGSQDRTIRLWSVPDGRLVGTLDAHAGAVIALSIRAAGTTLSSEATLASASSDRTVRVWTLTTQQQALVVEAGPVAVGSIALGATSVAVGLANGSVRRWSFLTKELLLDLAAHKGGVTAVAIHEASGVLASAGADSLIRLWALSDGSARGELRATAPASVLAFAGGRLLSGDRAGAIAQWDTSPAAFVRYLRDPAFDAIHEATTIKAHRGAVTHLMVSPDGRTLLSGSSDSVLKVWSFPDGLLRARFAGHKQGVTAAVMTPDAARFVSAAADRSLVAWSIEPAPAKPAPPPRGKPASPYASVRAGRVDRTISGPAGVVNALAMSTDGALLAGASADRFVHVWRMADGSPVARLPHAAAVRALAFSGDARTLASVGENDDVRVWSLPEGRLRAVLRQPARGNREPILALSPDGQLVATPTAGGPIEVWSLADGLLRHELRSHDRQVTSLLYAADASRLVSAAPDGVICVWAPATGRLIARFEAPMRGAPAAVRIATNTGATRVAVGTPGGEVFLWSVDDQRITAAFSNAGQSIASIVLSPDERWLAAGDVAGTVLIWGVEREQFERALFDPDANTADVKGLSYNVYDKITGITTTFTLPCGSPIPPGAVCTCNCVPGTVVVPRPVTPSGGRIICTCNKICTCVPIFGESTD
jgi:WD40 repeat protein